MNLINNTDKKSTPCLEWQCLHANFTIVVDLVQHPTIINNNSHYQFHFKISIESSSTKKHT